MDSPRGVQVQQCELDNLLVKLESNPLAIETVKVEQEYQNVISQKMRSAAEIYLRDTSSFCLSNPT